MNLITKFLHSRGALLLTLLLVAQAGWLCHTGSVESFAASMAANVLVVLLMIYLNRRFNLLRSMTMLYGVMFGFLQIASPEELGYFNSGILLAAVMGVCLVLMFGIYARPWLRRRVFLVFLLLSAGVTQQYAFAVYIPVMLLCCVQMRVFNARCLVAALLGVITPWWLLLGFGVIAPSDLHLPELKAVFSDISLQESLQLGAAALLAATLFVVCMALNFFRTIAYNARSRAYNGAVLLTGFVTIAAMLFDYGNITAYMPLLNVCAALLCAQFFVLHRTPRSWIGIVCILLVCLTLYIWNIA